MNWAKANMVICKALSQHRKVYGHPVSENYFLATADGVVGYVFPRDKIAFNLESVSLLKKKQIEDVFEHEKEEPQLKKTRIYLDLSGGGGFARRFVTNEFDVWIKAIYLNGFNNSAEFYQDMRETKVCRQSRIVHIVEDGITVGIVCPVRILDLELGKEITEMGVIGL